MEYQPEIIQEARWEGFEKTPKSTAENVGPCSIPGHETLTSRRKSQPFSLRQKWQNLFARPSAEQLRKVRKPPFSMHKFRDSRCQLTPWSSMKSARTRKARLLISCSEPWP